MPTAKKKANYGKLKATVDAKAKQNASVGKDMFTNAAGRMGFGTPSVAESAEYTLERWTNYYWLMITLFRNQWLCRKIIEIPARDATKAWPRLNTDALDPKMIGKFDRVISRTLTPQRIKRAITWARLFGGAGALMVIKGHEDILDKKLDLDSIPLDSFKGLIVFDRWSGINPTGRANSDIDSPADYMLPEAYTVHSMNGNAPLFDIHASRILRFCGPELPSPEYEATMYWGESVLEFVYEELRKRDNASWSILNLLFRAQILTQVNPELAQLLSGAAAGGQAMSTFARLLQAQNELLSNQSMLLLGKDGKLESHQYTFGGIAETLDRFELAVAASGDPPIPYSKLYGRNMSTLGQTNEADERNYEENIAGYQHSEMKPQLDKLYPVLCMSEFQEVPDDLDFIFPSIRVLTEEAKADLAQKGGQAIIEPFNAGITSQKQALQELKQLSDKTEIHSNISDEDIAKADDKPQVPIEVETAEARAGSAEFKEGGGSKGNDELPEELRRSAVMLESNADHWSQKFVQLIKRVMNK